MRCNAAKDDTLSERIAAQTVRAVQSSRDLAGSVDSFNRTVVVAQHARVIVDLDATYRYDYPMNPTLGALNTIVGHVPMQ